MTLTQPVLGQDVIYICQYCNKREKEFTLKSRNYKYCSACGNISVKSTLCDSYNYMTFNIPYSDEL
ncbi:MAG: hypothetical protein JHC33_02195 [Ignisphaera sp.]|nr:hypothetical protein [Ignisphaera sp.]